MRQTTFHKLKELHKISITPIPKVWIKITFRKDGSWHYDFGYRSYAYLRSTGQLYDESGKFIYKGKFSFMRGQDYTIHQLWHYIQKQAYFDKIHPLDLVTN